MLVNEDAGEERERTTTLENHCRFPFLLLLLYYFVALTFPRLSTSMRVHRPRRVRFTISRDRGFQPSRHFPWTILAMPICPFYSNVTFDVNSFSSSSSFSSIANSIVKDDRGKSMGKELMRPFFLIFCSSTLI